VTDFEFIGMARYVDDFEAFCFDPGKFCRIDMLDRQPLSRDCAGILSAGIANVLFADVQFLAT